MKRHINHRQLEAFRAVVDTGTVTAAAARLFITQPAVTRLLQDLEASIGLPLFERHKGRLSPTVEAKILYEEVDRSFIGLDQILQTAEDIRLYNTGALRIAAMPAVALDFLPRLIQRFSDLHPNISVSLQIRSSTKVMEWIASQQFDVGFAAVQQGHPAVRQEPLLRAPMLAVLPVGHRLAAKAELEPKDFEGESFISLGPELGMRGRVDEIFATEGVSRRLLIDAQLSAVICKLVAAGAGVALVDPVTAGEYRGRGVEVRPFAPRIEMTLSLLFPRHRSRSSPLQAFLELVQRELAANPLFH